jgi:hypothetical protein
MKEYVITMKVAVEDEELSNYEDIDDLMYSTMEEVPFSFSIENAKEVEQ